MKMPSGCQSRTSRTERWRRDKWAEEHALDSDGCMGRRVVWNEYCQREDVEVIFVGGSSMSSSKSLSTLQLGAKEAWPWSKKRGKAEEAEAQTKVDADTQVNADAEADSEVDYPDEPGCYMRMPSGCPKNPMKTDLWRHDAWAEHHDLDEAGCKGRKYVWDKFCAASDSKMVFVRSVDNVTLVEPARPVNLFSASPSWPWSTVRANAGGAETKPKAEGDEEEE
ncbi:unnamed protein product [Prorocentrum cordatum]|uniref:Uncharacterized protein n=1 Tax=Prorocentrum cordatum TaxID=2364126 RepID=A0ABN9RZJ7_9DINO|nr:unnamed protein product [Polarella glacialis]